MSYGKNQLALLKFLHKWPNKFHRVKRKKAIYAARRLSNKNIGVITFTEIFRSGWFYVKLEMPQILIKQN